MPATSAWLAFDLAQSPCFPVKDKRPHEQNASTDKDTPYRVLIDGKFPMHIRRQNPLNNIGLAC